MSLDVGMLHQARNNLRLLVEIVSPNYCCVLASVSDKSLVNVEMCQGEVNGKAEKTYMKETTGPPMATSCLWQTAGSEMGYVSVTLEEELGGEGPHVPSQFCGGRLKIHSAEGSCP